MKTFTLHYFYGMLIAFSLLFCANTAAQFAPVDVTPNEGGALPTFSVLDGLAAGKIGGLQIDRVHYYYFYFGGNLNTYATVDMSFPEPSTIGATTYTLQQYDYVADTWNDVEANGSVLTTNGYNFSIRLDNTGNIKYRLLVNGGIKNGYTSNEEVVICPVKLTNWVGNSLDYGMDISGVMYPNVGCGFQASARVKVYDEQEADFVDVNDTLHFVYEWYRRNPINYKMTKIEGANTAKYVTGIEDTGYEIVSVIKGDDVKLSFYIAQSSGTIKFTNKSSFVYKGNDGFIINTFYGIPNFDASALKVTTNLYDPQTMQSTIKEMPIEEAKEIIPGQYKIKTTLPQGYYLIESSNGAWFPTLAVDHMGDGHPLNINIETGTLKSELKLDNQVANGELELLQKRIEGNYLSFATKQTVDGKADFETTTGYYYLKTKQTDNTLATYFPNSTMWSDAKKIEQPMFKWDGDTIFTIQLQPKPAIPPSTAQGVIEGSITIISTPAGVHQQKVLAAPQMDIYTLYLKNKVTDAITATTQSDVEGKYHFTNVPIGEYEVLVDIPGKPMISIITANIVTNTTIVGNVNYQITEKGIEVKAPTGIDNTKMGSLIVYPNPFLDDIYISNNESIAKISLVNINGQTVFSSDFKGSNTLNFKHLHKGVYFLQAIMKNGEKAAVKLIKQ